MLEQNMNVVICFMFVYVQDEEEEAISKPVTMTPFELRKLYIETFPYSK